MTKKIVIIILMILILTNAIWMFISKFSGPLIALLFYSFIIFLFVYKKDFKSGIIAGIMGFSIHILELIFRNDAILSGIGYLFFSINLILPVALTYFSYRAKKGIR